MLLHLSPLLSPPPLPAPRPPLPSPLCSPSCRERLLSAATPYAPSTFSTHQLNARTLVNSVGSANGHASSLPSANAQ